MITKFLKKMVGISDVDGEKVVETFQDKLGKAQKFFEEKTDLVKQEYGLVRKKLENLSETNYQQGLKYLEKGDVRDAILRFRIVIRFWPEYVDAHYQLAYCLMLNGKISKAKKTLEHLLQLHPEYDRKAYDLLELINQKIANA